MYVGSQLGLIAFYLALVGGAIAVARSRYHAALTLALIGAVMYVVGSGLGGVLAGVLYNSIFGRSVTALQIIGGLVFVGLFEELVRILVLVWRHRRRNDRIEDAAMFGIGFGGAEVIWRAYTRLTALLVSKMTVQMTAWGSVWSATMCVEIFIWHVLLTLFVYRALRVEHLGFRIVALGLIVLYHTGLDFCGSMTAVLFGLGYSAILWSVLTPIHVWAILRLLNIRMRVPFGRVASIAG